MKKYMLMAAICVMAACSKDDDTDSSSVSTSIWDVQTTVGGTKQYYNGLTLQMGLAESSEPVATAVVDATGKASFQVDPVQYSGKEVWFGVPKMVKFFHTVTDKEASDGKIALPDMEKGSSLDETKLKNDWIVALYMGVNKDGKEDGAPLYWATGNLIACKTNGAGETTQTAFHVSTEEETIQEGTEENDFLKLDDRLEATADGYVNMPAGTKWNLFSYGDKTGLCLYGFMENDDFIAVTGQKKGDEVIYNISGNPDFDIATSSLGGTWRIPTGGKTGQNEYAAFEDDCEEYASLQPQGATYGERKNGFGVKFDYNVVVDGRKIITNTLKFPAVGYRHGTESCYGVGLMVTLWSATADPTMTPIWGVQGNPVMKPETVAFNFGWLSNQFNWFSHPRMSGAAVRPVTE
jgi:hypothetical protein